MAAFAFKSLAAVTAFVVQPSLALDNGLALTREYAPARTEGGRLCLLVPGDDG